MKMKKKTKSTGDRGNSHTYHAYPFRGFPVPLPAVALYRPAHNIADTGVMILK